MNGFAWGCRPAAVQPADQQPASSLGRQPGAVQLPGNNIGYKVGGPADSAVAAGPADRLVFALDLLRLLMSLETAVACLADIR